MLLLLLLLLPIYIYITEAVEGESRNWHEILEFGVRLALGGPAIGAVIGLAGAFILGYVINDALVEVSLTVLLAYCTFAICEATQVKVQWYSTVDTSTSIVL